MADIQNAAYKINTAGNTTVATAGTAVQLNGGTSVLCRFVRVSASSGNAGPVCVGPSNVKAASGQQIGTELAPATTLDFPVANVNQLYVDAQHANDCVSWQTFNLTD